MGVLCRRLTWSPWAKTSSRRPATSSHSLCSSSPSMSCCKRCTSRARRRFSTAQPHAPFQLAMSIIHWSMTFCQAAAGYVQSWLCGVPSVRCLHADQACSWSTPPLCSKLPVIRASLWDGMLLVGTPARLHLMHQVHRLACGALQNAATSASLHDCQLRPDSTHRHAACLS